MTADLAARSRARVWHPCTQMQDHESGELPLIGIAEARGAWLVGTDGKPYLDAVASWWTNVFGHRHPRIVARVQAQLEKLDHVLLAGFTHEPAVELAEKLCALTGLDRCFYSDNGSSAVEVALKMSAHYWRNAGQPKKTKFIALENGYHGETLGALAVGGTGLYRDPYEPLLMQAIRVPSPDCFTRTPGESWEDHSRRQFVHVQAALEQSAGQVAAVIVEPLVQCAAGMRMYHPVYLKLLREACTKHGVHLILDEIATGFGRTGKMFAFEWAGVKPDLLCVSKGLTGGTLPLAATLATDDLYRAFYAEHAAGKAFLHSHSYTGNPIACAAALGTLEVFAERDWHAHNRGSGHLMWMAVSPLLNHPQVAEVRQQGMILAIELAKNGARREPFPRAERRGLRAYRHALEQGVVLRPLGDVLYFMPPYVVTPEEIGLMARVAAEGIERAVA
ncbi:MAG TPA: adenosylmethionine--8-amino-7-oxononanoate transaminase [Candidatus Binatia bacterium]|nr:adenosylmethionine--8-amino-7-oxononanoate transaminase [Candidatus Binatia bacterium]